MRTASLSIAILADGSPTAGLGHIGRCMALAQAFWNVGRIRPVFLTGDKASRRWIHERGFSCRPPKTTPVDLLILDTYILSPASTSTYCRKAGAVLLLDDVGRPVVPARWVLNGSPGSQKPKTKGVLEGTWLLGARYHPLRQEFWGDPSPRVPVPRVRRLLVMLGGGAVGLRLNGVIKTVVRTAPDLFLDVVVGPGFKGRVPRRGRIRVHSSPKSLRPLMEKADLALSGGGQTLFQLARMGVPTIALSMAGNQEGNLRNLSRAGVLRVANASTLAATLTALIPDASARSRMSREGKRLIDGQGALRVVNRVLKDMDQ